MVFKCQVCKRTMTYDEELVFCPFCSSKYEKEFKSAGHQKREELLSLIPEILELRIEKGIELTLEYGLPKARLLKGPSFEENYLSFERAENKKQLIIELDLYLEELKGSLEGLNDLSRLEDGEIKDELGFSYERLNRALDFNYNTLRDLFYVVGLEISLDKFELDKLEHELVIESLDKNILINLYEGLLNQYEKFKSILMDHSLLAIFSHGYNVGEEQKAFNSLLKEDGDFLVTTTSLYEKTYELIKEAEKETYQFDFFDMDGSFIVHVEKFWQILENLSLFLSVSIKPVYKREGEVINLEEELKEKLIAFYKPVEKEIEKIRLDIKDYPLEKLEGILRGFELSIGG